MLGGYSQGAVVDIALCGGAALIARPDQRCSSSRGTGTYLGRVSAYEFVSLQQTGADSWALVTRC